MDRYVTYSACQQWGLAVYSKLDLAESNQCKAASMRRQILYISCGLLHALSEYGSMLLHALSE